MSWQDIMQRVLPPIGRVSPHITSPYGEEQGRPLGSSRPHRAVDFNYFGGQTGINLKHPALRSPVAGIVTKAGQDKFGTIAIRDANGFSHEILHTHSRHVTVGDPVAAGQLIGAMGNIGTVDPNHQYHAHYQLKDPAGNTINPSAFWDRQGPTDPNPGPPAYLQEYQQYLKHFGTSADNGFSNAPGAASGPSTPFVPPGDALSSDRSESFGVRFGDWASSPAASLPPPPSDPLESFGNRFGNWGSAPARSFGDADSPLLRALEKYRRSAAPDGTRSVATAPSPAPSSPPLPKEKMRRLVGQIVDNPRASAFDSGTPAAPSPSNGFLAADGGDSFGNGVGSWTSTGEGVTPQQSQDSAPSYSKDFVRYLSRLTADQSQVPRLLRALTP